jgi:microcystin-dependent protein
MVLAPTPVLQFTDNNGNLLTGGLLFTYAAGTTTKQSAFTDSSGNTPLPNPIVLNSAGEVCATTISGSCGLWLDPSLSYKIVLAPATAGDPPTSSFWTIDNIVSPETAVLNALAAYEATIGGVPIGLQAPFAGVSAPNGWLLCYGQAVSRTTYALLFAIVGTTYGIGDGSSTFNLPDKRGRVSVGKDNMGGAAANRITAAVCGLDGTVQGGHGGDQHAQADTIVASSSAVSVVTDPGHLHHSNGLLNGIVGAGFLWGSGGSGWSFGTNTDSAFTGITVSTSVTTTASSSLTGATQNVQPTEIDNWIIFTGVGG